jgi:hypothetical protein
MKYKIEEINEMRRLLARQYGISVASVHHDRYAFIENQLRTLLVGEVTVDELRNSHPATREEVKPE